MELFNNIKKTHNLESIDELFDKLDKKEIQLSDSDIAKLLLIKGHRHE